MTYTLERVEVGILAGELVPDCVAPTQPFKATLRDDDTGLPAQLYGCFDPTGADECADDSIIRVLHDAGFPLTDDPCDYIP